MITQETAATIWAAYREIESGNKLLEDLKACREKYRLNKTEPVFKDAFGKRRNLQLGIPTGDNGHRLLDVPPELAESMINVHIAAQKQALVIANEVARNELMLPAAE